jgi:hypothetical protein
MNVSPRISRQYIPFVAAVVLISAFITPVSQATSWFVPTQAPTIQAGIDSAAVGDTVIVACGTYYEHSISLRPGVSLRSDSNDPTCVTIDAQALGRVMSSVGYFTNINYSISGITFTGGHADGAAPERWGGGLYCVDVKPTISRCVFRGNSALPYGQGGGVFVRGPHYFPNLFDCVIIDNSADYGGGLRCYDRCESQFTRCVIDSNYAQSEGGGVYSNFGGTLPTFRNCDIIGNRSYERGAGVYASTGTIIEYCTIAGNTTSHPTHSYGGGIWAQYLIEMTYCTIADNRAIYGGGIYTMNSYLDWRNSIIANNYGGRAVYNGNAYVETELQCVDIYGNAGGNWFGFIEDDGQINRNFSADPMFCRDANGDHPYSLQVGSPCLPNASCGGCGAQSLGCATTGVEDLPPDGATISSWGCNPNPFNATATITYDLNRTAEVTVGIYDIRGALVTILVSRSVELPGHYEVNWRGADEHGYASASGVYYCRISANSETQVGRLMMIK